MSQDHVAINKSVWDEDAKNWVAMGEHHWSLPEPVWGNWGEAESKLGLLPPDMTGMAAVELGCGTGYVSSWMARRGAEVTAIDVSPEQLSTARRLAVEHAAEISFIEGNCEATGLRDASFDFAVSEYGAAIWCRPEVWLAEAWRILRPGGRLVFLGNHPLSLICAPESGAPTDWTLHRPYKDMWGADWTKVEIEPSGVCFNLTISDWMELFARIGFTVQKYQEVYAPDHANDTRGEVPADWAKSYPVEQVWHLQRPS